MSKENYFLKNFRATVGKAINDFKMLKNNDRILVGFSGGKDSLALFDTLFKRKSFVPIDYELIPVFVYNGEFSETLREVEKFFKDYYNCNVIIKTVNIKEFVISEKSKENPCFVCSKIRRKIFFDLAYQLKCNKLALGHNMDDMNETLLLNIIFSGNISTMLPKQSLFKGGLNIIRPLIYLTEEQILKYVKINELPIIEKKCTYRGKSKNREIIKNFINSLYKENKKVKKNIANSVRNVNLEYLPVNNL
jgi:tRNA 2-thiocytidine biosynthesis protein TtcA